MTQIFISNIKINKVRHLNNITIDLSEEERKHLVITGKNGSGKTSLLDAIARYLNLITNSERVENYTDDVLLKMNCASDDVFSQFKKGNLVVAYYKANRVFEAQIPRHVEKVELKKDYSIEEFPRKDFIKYLLDLKMTQALALANNKNEKAEKIKLWFDKFQNLLKDIFEDESVILDFDEETFKFYILMNGRETFEFNTLSSGYAAVFDIVADLMLRMEKHTDKVFDFSIPGIVLIDEIETHLHLTMQKKILELLTTFFPNIQFIVSTHSPFILNSLENAAIYDLENHIFVKDGLADIPYSGIVKGYFNADEMSKALREKYEKYKMLVNKAEITDDDLEEIADLEMYLNEIPDYLALNITTEYQRLKTELRNREDI